MKVFISILKTIISIINVFLIIIIILNIFNLALTYLQDSDYVSFLDYTYKIVEEDNEYLEVKTGDLLFVDLKLSSEKDEIAIYKGEDGITVGKITNIGTEDVIINDGTTEVEVNKELVIGKIIKVIPVLGNILNVLLTPLSLGIMIGILIVTSIIQSLLNKQKKKMEPKKPNFNDLSHV